MSFPSQLTNRNFLSPGGFRFSLGKYPKVSYFAQSANIPGIQLKLIEQETMYRSIYRDGTLEYQNFTLRFMVDEDLENYMILHNWMRGLGVPDNFSERATFEKLDTEPGIGAFPYADGTLTVLNSSYQPKFNIAFKDLNPTSLTTLEFDASLTDTDYFTATVEFDYLSFQVQDLNGNRIDKLS